MALMLKRLEEHWTVSSTFTKRGDRRMRGGLGGETSSLINLVQHNGYTVEIIKYLCIDWQPVLTTSDSLLAARSKGHLEMIPALLPIWLQKDSSHIRLQEMCRSFRHLVMLPSPPLPVSTAQSFHFCQAPYNTERIYCKNRATYKTDFIHLKIIHLFIL